MNLLSFAGFPKSTVVVSAEDENVVAAAPARKRPTRNDAEPVLGLPAAGEAEKRKRAPTEPNAEASKRARLAKLKRAAVAPGVVEGAVVEVPVDDAAVQEAPEGLDQELEAALLKRREMMKKAREAKSSGSGVGSGGTPTQPPKGKAALLQQARAMSEARERLGLGSQFLVFGEEPDWDALMTAPTVPFISEEPAGTLHGPGTDADDTEVSLAIPRTLLDAQSAMLTGQRSSLQEFVDAIPRGSDRLPPEHIAELGGYVSADASRFVSCVFAFINECPL